MTDKKRLRNALIALVVAAGGLGLVGGVATAGGGPDRAAGIPNLSTVKTEIVEYHDSGAWNAEYAKVESGARRDVQHALAGRHRTGRPAIVLDIDDSALSSYPYEVANDFGYAPAVFNSYVADGRFVAIPATVSLVTWAEAHGVHVFYVTGRRDATVTRTDGTVEPMRTATVDNLTAQGFPPLAQTDLVLRPTSDTAPSVVPYKSAARAAIEAQGYDILANLGDQYSDLDGGHADHAYKLPNPMYSIP